MLVTSKAKKKVKHIGTVLLFVLPATIPLMLFWVYPMMKSIFISFTDYMTSDYNIVGLTNYKDLFSDEAFISSLKNTFVFTIGTLIPTIVLGLAIAVVLRRNIKGSALYKAIIFSPWITPTVAISIVWSWILEPEYGFANYILGLFNFPQLQWLKSSDTAMLGVILVTVWKSLGWAMVFYLTALERVPHEIYEAADGKACGEWELKS